MNKAYILFGEYESVPDQILCVCSNKEIAEVVRMHYINDSLYNKIDVEEFDFIRAELLDFEVDGISKEETIKNICEQYPDYDKELVEKVYNSENDDILINVRIEEIDYYNSIPNEFRAE